MTIALTENFDDNSRDTAKWNLDQLWYHSGVSTTGVTVNEANQRLEVTPPSATSGNRANGYVAANTYDLTNNDIYIRMDATGMPGGQEAWFSFGTQPTDRYTVLLSDGSVYLQRSSSSSTGNLASTAYNATNHRWFRLRHQSSDNTIKVDAAPDSGTGPGTWVNLFSVARDALVTINGTKPGFGAATYTALTATTVQFDGFNTQTTGASAVTHAASGALNSQAATLSGTSTRFRAHASSGTVAGAGASLAGAAAHNIPHASTGVLGGSGGAVTGSAARNATVVTHTATGALTGGSASLAGVGARLRAFSVTGALQGQGSALTGSASRVTFHVALGGLAGPGSAVAGSAAHLAIHGASGIIVGPGSAMGGQAFRQSAGWVVNPDAAAGAWVSEADAAAGWTIARDAAPTAWGT